MKFKLLLFFVFSSSVIFAQHRKTVRDSVFNKGDIVKIPNLAFTMYGQFMDWNTLNNDAYSGRPVEMIANHPDSIKIIVEFIKKYPNILFELGNFSDCRGSQKHNEGLTLYHCMRIMEALKKDYGITEEQVKIKGYGNLQPIVPCAKIIAIKDKKERERLYAINRRYELKILEVK